MLRKLKKRKFLLWLLIAISIIEVLGCASQPAPTALAPPGFLWVFSMVL
jgi:hypothetical protein